MLGNGKMIILGCSPKNKAYILNVANGFKWVQIKHIEFSRVGHTASLVSGKLYIFGGAHENNDVYLYDTQNLSSDIVRVKTHGQKPTARFDHAAVNIGFELFIFGGFSYRAHENDLYALNLQYKGWTKVMASGDVPRPM